LSQLQILNLSQNQLAGSIPSELGNLSQLQWLSLSHNQFTGSIPSELGNLGQVQRLEMAGNQLSGSIPLELGQLRGLLMLDMMRNQLCGLIPPFHLSFGDSSTIQIALSHNDLLVDSSRYAQRFVDWLDRHAPSWSSQSSPTPCADEYLLVSGDGYCPKGWELVSGEELRADGDPCQFWEYTVDEDGNSLSDVVSKRNPYFAVRLAGDASLSGGAGTCKLSKSDDNNSISIFCDYSLCARKYEH